VSISILDEQHIDLGQFASNAGYSDLIKNASGAALTNLLDKGYSEHVPQVIEDIHRLRLTCQDKDVCSTAKCLEQLIQGQQIVIIHDGTSNGDQEDNSQQPTQQKLKASAIASVRKLFAGGPGSGCHGPNCGKPKGTVILKNSLRIPRSQMPQITKADLQDYVYWLKHQGIKSHEETVDPSSLKPIQKTVNENVAKALPADVNIPGRPMLISEDSYIEDGHHRWYRALLDNKTLNVVRIHAPMSKLLDITHNYPKVEYHTPHETAKKWKVAASNGLL